jgi:hypothetical protein
LAIKELINSFIKSNLWLTSVWLLCYGLITPSQLLANQVENLTLTKKSTWLALNRINNVLDTVSNLEEKITGNLDDKKYKKINKQFLLTNEPCKLIQMTILPGII